MRSSRVRRVFLFALAGTLACAGRPPPEDFVLRVGVIEPMGEVGPHADSGGAALAGDLLFEPLATPRPGGAASKFLRRWERLGPRRWRLDLEPGVRFNDGTPVAAGDVADAVRAQGMTVLSTTPATVEVEARGAYPVEVDLAFATVARRTATGWLGTGAFAVESQEPHRVVLRRVQPAPGRIARVELVGCASSREAFARLLRGELNGMASLDRALAELLDGVPGLQVVRGTAPSALAAWLSPRLPAEERRRIAAAIPVAEIAAAARAEPCCSEPQPALPPVPPGRPLRIGYPRYLAEQARAAIALRRALGARGGDVVPLDPATWVARAVGLDLMVLPMLVRPPGVAAHYFETGGRYNAFGHSDPVYDAALAAGDERAQEEELRRAPQAVVILRRERLVALDARIQEPVLGDWGTFERLPEWQVAP